MEIKNFAGLFFHCNLKRKRTCNNYNVLFCVKKVILLCTSNVINIKCLLKCTDKMHVTVLSYYFIIVMVVTVVTFYYLFPLHRHSLVDRKERIGILY